MSHLTVEKLEAHLNQKQCKGFSRIVAFSPTGWTGNYPYRKEYSPHLTIHRVPYSEHSTFSELRTFVSLLANRPFAHALEKIIPTVGSHDLVVACFKDLIKT